MESRAARTLETYYVEDPQAVVRFKE